MIANPIVKVNTPLAYSNDLSQEIETSSNWPEISSKAKIGLLSEFLDLIEPATEANLGALIIPSLVAIGGAMNRGIFYRQDQSNIYSNEFGIVASTDPLLGKSVQEFALQFASIGSDRWQDDCVRYAISTQEGMIQLVRDEAIVRNPANGRDETVSGVDHKNKLFIENDLYNLSKIGGRDGNNLIGSYKQAWISDRLGNYTRTYETRADNAHITFLARTSFHKPDDARVSRRYADMMADFAPYCLCAVAKRVSNKSQNSSMEIDYTSIETRINNAIRAAEKGWPLTFATGNAYERWDEFRLANNASQQDGLLGLMDGVANIHVLKLCCIYCGLEGSKIITEQILEAALAVYEFSRSSTLLTFATVPEIMENASGMKIIMNALVRHSRMSQTEIGRLFGSHKTAEVLRWRVLLESSGRVEIKSEGGTLWWRFIR